MARLRARLHVLVLLSVVLALIGMYSLSPTSNSSLQRVGERHSGSVLLGHGRREQRNGVDPELLLTNQESKDTLGSSVIQSHSSTVPLEQKRANEVEGRFSASAGEERSSLLQEVSTLSSRVIEPPTQSKEGRQEHFAGGEDPLFDDSSISFLVTLPETIHVCGSALITFSADRDLSYAEREGLMSHLGVELSCTEGEEFGEAFSRVLMSVPSHIDAKQLTVTFFPDDGTGQCALRAFSTSSLARLTGQTDEVEFIVAGTPPPGIRGQCWDCLGESFVGSEKESGFAHHQDSSSLPAPSAGVPVPS